MQIHEPKPLGYDSRLQLFSAFFCWDIAALYFFTKENANCGESR
jgi:hypothetical protein